MKWYKTFSKLCEHFLCCINKHYFFETHEHSLAWSACSSEGSLAVCAPLRSENRNPRYIVLHCSSCTVPYVYTLHTGFGSSQTLQNLTKFIFKNINTYDTKYTNYETTFYNKSNNIDLALSILKLLSISFIKVKIL